MTDDNEIKIMGVYLIGVHPYAFRSGKPSFITGVKTICGEGMKPRICYETTFPDGFIDYVPLSDVKDGHYKMDVCLGDNK